MGIFARLKERRFFQILASYLAAGWVAVEVVAQLVERHTIPEITYDVVLIWYVGGIGAALLIGWYHGEKGNQRAPVRELAALTLLGVATLGLTGSTVATYIAKRAARTAAEASTLDLKRVAVLYLDDLSSDGELSAAADGFTESLIGQLSTVKGLEVLSRGAVQQFRGKGAVAERVGRTLRAGTVVAGSIERVGKQVHVVLRLLDGQEGIEFQRTSFDVQQDKLLTVRDSLATRAAAMLREWVGKEVRVRSTRRGTENVAAWLQYQRAEKLRKEGEEAGRGGDAATFGARLATADSLLAEAERADGSWGDPAILRGEIAYRRARVSRDPRQLQRFVQEGLSEVAPALALDPNDAHALEVRGTLKYWLWLQDPEADPARAQALFDAARADLEQAVRLDPALASAHATLSHLYINVPDLPAAVLAARRAYEEDAYLENADAVVWRLVTSTYSIEQFAEMNRWCGIGHERFPRNYRFTVCQIQVMTTPAADADVPRAWTLLASLDSLAPGNQMQFEHLRAELAIAGVLARAGLRDSARHVITRAHAAITPKLDPARELVSMEAYVLTMLGDYDRAVDLLKLDAALHPGSKLGDHWWWRELRTHPRWREIAGS